MGIMPWSIVVDALTYGPPVKPGRAPGPRSPSPGKGNICSREGCGRPAPLRVAVWFLVWWSCSRHLDELIELIQEHGFPVTYAQVPVNPVTPDASS